MLLGLPFSGPSQIIYVKCFEVLFRATKYNKAFKVDDFLFKVFSMDVLFLKNWRGQGSTMGRVDARQSELFQSHWKKTSYVVHTQTLLCRDSNLDLPDSISRIFKVQWGHLFRGNEYLYLPTMILLLSYWWKEEWYKDIAKNIFTKTDSYT